MRQSKWVDWNYYVDELSFAQAFRTKLVSVGFDSNIGMLIDTSRNGWGGAARPDRPRAPSTDVNTFVNGSRASTAASTPATGATSPVPASASARGPPRPPASTPTSGSSRRASPTAPARAIPNDEGKGFDRMCDPTYTGNARNGNSMTGALPERADRPGTGSRPSSSS